MVLVVELCEFWVLGQLSPGKLEVFLGDFVVLLYLGNLASDDCLGAFAPLSVHEVRFLELVFKEPIPVDPIFISPLASDDESLSLSAIPCSGLCALVEESLGRLEILEHDVIGLFKTPGVGKLMYVRAWKCCKVWHIEVDSMEIDTGGGLVVRKNMLLEMVITELPHGSSIHPT